MAQPQLGLEERQVISVPVRRGQFNSAAVQRMRAVNDAIEVGEHKCHIDRDLDLALLGHRHHSTGSAWESGTLLGVSIEVLTAMVHD